MIELSRRVLERRVGSLRGVFLVCALALTTPAFAQSVARVEHPPASLARLPDRVVGRVQKQGDGGVLRQWPGTYFETAFEGSSVFFRIGEGQVSLRVTVDGGAPIALVKPTSGVYAVLDLRPGPHRLRLDMANESQSGPSQFGGFFVGEGAVSAPLQRPARQIEFIGDSHTVGYANTSSKRQCAQDEIWTTTDTSRGIAPLTARRFGADYQANAISGRGIVRNYNGLAADTLPQAYPFALFDKAQRAATEGWRPQVIIIGLGTNDFSTALNPGEPWKTRDELHAAYESQYVKFVQGLRVQNPQAYVLLWATDFGGGEIQAEVSKVADQLRRAGDERVGYVPVSGLGFAACDSHPDLADDQRIAEALIGHIDARPEIWR
jgi:lysophospholipase L1-like esterase